MKTLIIYSSIHHGNTEKIAKIIGQSINADIIKAKAVDMNILNEYDLIGFGSGIYKGKFHKNITDLIDVLPKFTNKKAFIFSTSGVGRKKYNRPIEKAVREHNLEVVGSFSCKGHDTNGFFKLFGGISKGRPNNKDFENAKEFAQKLIC